MDTNTVRDPAGQALVSDEAASHLRPSGFDPSRVEALEDVLRGLASYVGVGGFNAETVDPRVFDDKIRWGIHFLVNVAIQRCADVVEEQSKNYARATWGTCRRAILDLKTEETAGHWGMMDWRIGQMHAELEHLVTSVKGGELYCGLCNNLVGEDGTLHPRSCPLSYGYDHIRVLRDSDGSGEAGETAQTGSTAGDSAGRKASPPQPIDIPSEPQP